MSLNLKAKCIGLSFLSLGFISCGNQSSHSEASGLERRFTTESLAQDLYQFGINEFSIFAGEYSEALKQLMRTSPGVLPDRAGGAVVIIEMPVEASRDRISIEGVGITKVFGWQMGGEDFRNVLISMEDPPAKLMEMSYDMVKSNDPVGTIVDLVRMGVIQALNLNLDMTRVSQDLARATELLLRLKALSANGVASGSGPRITVNVLAGGDGSSLTNTFLAAHESLESAFPGVNFRIAMVDKYGRLARTAAEGGSLFEPKSPQVRELVAKAAKQAVKFASFVQTIPNPNDLAALNEKLALRGQWLRRFGSATYQGQTIRVTFDRVGGGSPELISASVRHADGNSVSVRIISRGDGTAAIEARYLNENFKLNLGFEIADALEPRSSLTLEGRELAKGDVVIGERTGSLPFSSFVAEMEAASELANKRIALEALDPKRAISHALTASEIGRLYDGKIGFSDSVKRDLSSSFEQAGQELDLNKVTEALESLRPRISKITEEHKTRLEGWEAKLYDRFVKPRLKDRRSPAL